MSTLNNDNKKENRAMNEQRKTTMTRREGGRERGEKCILAEWVSIRCRWKRHHYENERRIKREGEEKENKPEKRRRKRRRRRT